MAASDLRDAAAPSVSRLAAGAAATAATWSEARARPRPRPRPGAGGPFPLALRLDEAALSGPAHVEEAGRAAVARGSAADEPLHWAAERAAAGRREEAAAAASGVIRARGYGELLAWARDEQAGAPDVNVLPDFAADHRIYDLPAPLVIAGDAIRHKLATDHPRLGSPAPAVYAGPPLQVFSPDALTVLETEEPTQTETFAMSIQGISESEFEDTILPLSRIPGVNALIFAGLFLASVVQPMEFLGWVGQDVYQLPRSGTPNRPENTTVLRTPGDLAGPAGAVKYMIFSDIHRDASQDAAVGIHHFGKNQLQYQRILDWCASQNYIVLENGDAEELWYVPTFGAGRQPLRDRLQDIVQRHPGVYSRLATLASQNRYFRTIGNHDSYLWEDADTRAWCQQVNFASPAGAFLIPQCKSLDDFLPPVFIGLSSFPYKDRKDMLVIHGHQFDFWNCDEHNWLGKFITNAVAVPLDALDDPLFQYRGIDRQGNVYFRFSDFVGRYEPWANWPAGPTARTWAQALEGRPLSENMTKDSIMFLETLVAAVGATLNTGAGLGSFGVQTCLGHTHNPQVRPDIPYLDPLLNDWLGAQLGVDVPPGVINLRTRYINSGTVGWWEGIVWAIEISTAGDVSLVYWAAEDAEPVRMDWEVD